MTRSLSRITSLSLALVALAAPTAVARPDARATHSNRSAGSSGFPQRPVLDRNPSPPSSSQPTAAPGAALGGPADHGTDWATIGISLAAGLLTVGGAAGVARRTHRSGDARVSA